MSVNELVANFRGLATLVIEQQAEIYRYCADELEAALQQQSNEADASGEAVGVEGAVQPMTNDRAIYFMQRFKRDEKMLGPNEQKALDYVIAFVKNHAPEIRAALELKAKVEAGWVLVPREPTMEMIAASDEISCRNEGREHWANMLNAAPPAQESEDGS